MNVKDIFDCPRSYWMSFNWKLKTICLSGGFKTRVFKFDFKTDSENPKTEKLNFWISEFFWEAQFLIYCFFVQEFWLCFDLGKKISVMSTACDKKRSKYFFPSFRTQCIFSCCCSPFVSTFRSARDGESEKWQKSEMHIIWMESEGSN